jgi:lysophospholipase L1-like esterase
MTATGLALKYTVARSSEEIRHTLAIVVPFVLLRGDVMLGLDAKELEAEQEPSIPVSRQDSIESEPVQTTPNEEEKKPSYAFLPAEENYFDSVLFIGDSRTVGLALYGRLGKADYFADVGMSLFNLLDKKISDTGFASQDLKTLLQTKKYYAIYLMLGINEVGYPMQSIEKKLQSVLDEISTMQPDALIVLQANLGVTQEKETKNPQLSMDRIRTLNDTIKSYADEEKKIFYLDVNPFFADDAGYLRSEVTSDGTHPYAVEYKNWAAWLKEHAIQEKIT